MTDAPGSRGASATSPGRLGKAITRLFMKHANVSDIEDIAPRFRLVTLEGTALCGVTWSPGQKLQIAMGSPFVARTYTPIDWDPVAGRTRFLGFAHGDGPGSEWLLNLGLGDGCEVFGPRSSLDADRAAPPLALFGDETSIGLAYAVVTARLAQAVHCYFEVEDADSGRRVLERLGLDDATLVVKHDDARNLQPLGEALDAFGTAGASFVLTGQAGTIQRLRHRLKDQGVASTRIFSKAYWAPGKRGLD